MVSLPYVDNCRSEVVELELTCFNNKKRQISIYFAKVCVHW